MAFNFSSEKGIIVQLSKFASLDSHYLDVSDLHMIIKYLKNINKMMETCLYATII